MYKISDKTYQSGDARLNDALAAVYGSSQRPMCMCRPKGVEMYVAKVGQQFIIKRMPHSGASHAADCDSYEPPAELSGLGEVMGGAIQTNLADGLTTLKLDFALTKNGSRAAPAPSGAEHDSVRTDGKKLTLRGTLHYLYDEAGLTRWSPAMQGKRSWWVVRKYLLQAAVDKVAKGTTVADLLFVPESFSMEKKDEISRRRQSVFHALAQADGSARRLMLLVGEVKEMGSARFGMKMVIKHMADAHFMMNEDLYKRLLKRFGHELELWAGNDNSHLMIVATFGVSGAGIASLEEASLMLVNENWIPYENVDEKLLLDALTSQKRRFTKGLRYNLASTTPLASVVLSDTADPVAMYVTSFGASDEYRRQLAELTEASDLAAWHWDTSEAMREFPPASVWQKQP
ncbi:hypothetical protein LMG19282_01503 [Cupriavidus campinensis]|uniref:DUF1173 domain-containing protein n=1 Tax=Cupriavidus campinensis TaxID=151783 RepID=A0ABY3EJ98_9BURK|nr:DUF1173 domain-containing protein [Cupriavidus campinensis]TSP10970.1 DUF1173 domain-containing protein [Cupriavidus campinensis]CAG2138485.1 hypothetical protein LMG19282_01503 [Cupriavidus campinensis]